MPEYEMIIVRYGELGIKSPPVRRRFEKKLISNIRSSLECKVDIQQGRIILSDLDVELAIENLKKIPGIVSFSPAISINTDFNLIRDSIIDYTKKLVSEDLFSSDKSFAVRGKRVGVHDFTSQEMAAFVGSVIISETNSPVNLTNPDFEFFVEVREEKTYIYHEKISGLGGMPVGTQGKIVSLLSSGIDSPVATFLMMKRGCEVIALHFNNEPYTTSKSTQKVKKIAEKLKSYSSGVKFKLYMVKYGDYLKNCKDYGPERMTCVLCKNGMYKIAEKIAQEENALAIVDGSSLGQVASQTLPNIVVTRNSVKTPILSPLIGFDKLEIEKIAKNIGTYEISIESDRGCSAVPRYPETNSTIEKLLKAEEDVNTIDELEKVFFSKEIIY
ncbi:MAG: tRNA uracil 4-sulfurtransferase ThiI [Methanobacteriaceae archaeon]|nr:tRNA uracil 4-sulfurtransferase ThiI [Methanobacteriaceae archaeon]